MRESKITQKRRRKVEARRIYNELHSDEHRQALFDLYSKRLITVVDPERKKALFEELREKLGESPRKRPRRGKLDQLGLF